MQIHFDLHSMDAYRLFLRIKALPRYRIAGRTAEIPDEYAALIGVQPPMQSPSRYHPIAGLFDYQEAIASLAIRKRKFAVFVEPGYGKTLILSEFARQARIAMPGRRILIVGPSMVIRQTLSEIARFYPAGFQIERVSAAGLPEWTKGGGGRCGVTNYEAITDRVTQGRLGAILLDESSLLKSHYGKWGTRLIELGKGLDWKLCCTGTPAPNDRIEYANHAVFLDQFPTVNAFLARYFVNRGQTDNRWELKAHALRPFYRSLSDWCIFMSSPATYGWKDNAAPLPPIHVHIHDVPLTDEQAALVHKAGGDMFGTPGGITSRAKLAQLAKGRHDGENVPSHKAGFIRDLVQSWPDESTIIWCRYNAEQETIAAQFPGCANISGATPDDEREALIDDFQVGRRRIMVSKPKIMGFGLNLQIATRQVFSTCQDSYEEYFQCVKRSNRVGSTRSLNVHLPVTPIERPMIDTVLRKAADVAKDTAEQEMIFKEMRNVE